MRRNVMKNKTKALICIIMLLFLVGCNKNQTVSIGDEAVAHITKWSTYMKENDAEKVANLYSDPYTYVKMILEPEIDFIEVTESRQTLKDELGQLMSEMPCIRCDVTIEKVVANENSAIIEAQRDLYFSADGVGSYFFEGSIKWVIEKQGEKLYIVYED